MFCGNCGAPIDQMLGNGQAGHHGKSSGVDLQTAIRLGFKRYVDFKGRSIRSEFWWWTLFSVAVSICLFLLDMIIMAPFGHSGDILELGVGPFSGLFGLVTLVPGIAVGVRRLHDVNRSGWWILCTIVGWLLILPGLALTVVLIFWFIRQGDQGDNRFGSNPHMVRQ